MKPRLIILSLCLLAGAAAAQHGLNFDDFFVDQALRSDLYQVGDAREEWVTVDRIVREPIWPGSTTRLLDPFGYGRYALKVYDVATNRLIFSQGFDCLFAEYRTTGPALAGVKRTFSRPVRFPCPKGPVRLVIERRDKENILHPMFSQLIDPADYHIITESPAAGDWIFPVQQSGDPHEKVDVVFIAEGYAAADKDKFQADAERAAGWLFEVEPYKSARDRFNVRAIYRPSPESGMDEPRQGAWRKTVLNASFNAFDLDRYQLTEETRALHDLAAQVPYDAIIVLVNSKRYGGGSIGGDYCITTVDHARSAEVMVHELGHSFAGLADEYYLAEVSYNDMYPAGVEPLEPNITRFLNPDRLKWKDLASPGLALPTDWGKARIEALEAEQATGRKAMQAEIDRAKLAKAAEADIQKTRDAHAAIQKELDGKLAAVRKEYESLEDKVGLFEGAGYTTQGMYRPMIHCIMIASPKKEFCLVCQRAIRDMIDFVCGK
jgi:hypothetical protein